MKKKVMNFNYDQLVEWLTKVNVFETYVSVGKKGFPEQLNVRGLLYIDIPQTQYITSKGKVFTVCIAHKNRFFFHFVYRIEKKGKTIQWVIDKAECQHFEDVPYALRGRLSEENKTLFERFINASFNYDEMVKEIKQIKTPLKEQELLDKIQNQIAEQEQKMANQKKKNDEKQKEISELKKMQQIGKDEYIEGRFYNLASRQFAPLWENHEKVDEETQKELAMQRQKEIEQCIEKLKKDLPDFIDRWEKEYECQKKYWKEDEEHGIRYLETFDIKYDEESLVKMYEMKAEVEKQIADHLQETELYIEEVWGVAQETLHKIADRVIVTLQEKQSLTAQETKTPKDSSLLKENKIIYGKYKEEKK